jgi:hypothetical protein
MNIGAILNLNGLFQTCDQAPELSLDVIFRDRARAVEDGIERHLVLKVALLEVGGLLLELLERVDAALFEAKLTVANETPRAMPVIVGLVGDARVKAIHVIAMVARLADQDIASVIALPAMFTLLMGV